MIPLRYELEVKSAKALITAIVTAIVTARPIMSDLIPVRGILTGIIIPVPVFVWLCFDDKGKR